MRVLSIAPTRVSIFGGGTDLPIYYQKYGGIVISMSINIRQKIELADEGRTKSYLPGSDPDFYNAFLTEMGFEAKSLKTDFDGVIESGLGSSASAAVALMAAIARVKGLPMGRRDIAEKAWDIEVNKIGLYGGKQDQYAAAMGGINSFWFQPSGGVTNKELHDSKSFLEHSVVLFYTGENRKDAHIQDKFKTPLESQVMALHDVKKIASQGLWAIEKQDFNLVGRLLNEAWEAKKRSNPLVTNERIDYLYELGLQCGASAGKIMGSGGGGYMFFWCDNGSKKLLIKTMEENGCKWVDFCVDRNGVETKVI